jgi:hypothetical protein
MIGFGRCCQSCCCLLERNLADIVAELAHSLAGTDLVVVVAVVVVDIVVVVAAVACRLAVAAAVVVACSVVAAVVAADIVVAGSMATVALATGWVVGRLVVVVACTVALVVACTVALVVACTVVVACIVVVAYTVALALVEDNIVALAWAMDSIDRRRSRHQNHHRNRLACSLVGNRHQVAYNLVDSQRLGIRRLVATLLVLL